MTSVRGDPGIVLGHASDETEDAIPLTHSMAIRLGKKLTDVRKNCDLWRLRPDGMTEVTIEYVQRVNGSVEARNIHYLYGVVMSVSIHRLIWPRSTPSMSCACSQSFFAAKNKCKKCLLGKVLL